MVNPQPITLKHQWSWNPNRCPNKRWLFAVFDLWLCSPCYFEGMLHGQITSVFFSSFSISLISTEAFRHSWSHDHWFSTLLTVNRVNHIQSSCFMHHEWKLDLLTLPFKFYKWIISSLDLCSKMFNINFKQEVDFGCLWLVSALHASFLDLKHLINFSLKFFSLAPFPGQRGRGGERGDGAHPTGVSWGIPQGQGEPGFNPANQDPAETVHIAVGGLPAPQTWVGGA